MFVLFPVLTCKWMLTLRPAPDMEKSLMMEHSFSLLPEGFYLNKQTKTYYYCRSYQDRNYYQTSIKCKVVSSSLQHATTVAESTQPKNGKIELIRL